MKKSKICPLPSPSLLNATSTTDGFFDDLKMYLDLLESTPNCSCHDAYLPEISLNCESFPIQHAIPTQIFYAALFTSTIILSLIGNITVLWIVLRHRKMRTVTNYYLLNLAIADISISIFNTGFSWIYNFYYHWMFGSFYCKINHLMGVTPICGSIFTMLVMGLDRYYAIVHPLKKRPGRRVTVCAIAAIWFLSIAFGIPALLASQVETTYFYHDKQLIENSQCLSDHFPDGTTNESMLNAWYNNTLVIIQYVLPLIVLSWAYYRVGIVLRKDQPVGDSHHKKSIKSKKKAAYMLGLVALIFMVVWLPYHTYYFVLSFYTPSSPSEHVTIHFIYINIYWLAMSSTVVNPIIYYYMNKRFRVGFSYAFRWLPCVRGSHRDYRSVLNASQNGRTSLLTCPAQNSVF